MNPRFCLWIKENRKREKVFKLIYKYPPLMVFLLYGIIILYNVLNCDKMVIIKIIAVPMVTFIIVTIFRKLVNRKRPYEALDIKPLIVKNKSGESFPSRHVVSAVIISFAGLYTNIYLGLLLMCLSVVIIIVRPLAGIHYVSDVIFGALISIIFGYIGFYMI